MYFCRFKVLSMMTCWSGVVEIWMPMCIEFGLEWVLKEYSRGDRNALNPYTMLFFGHWLSAILTVYLPEILGRPPAQTLEDVLVLEMRSHLSVNQIEEFYLSTGKQKEYKREYSERR